MLHTNCVVFTLFDEVFTLSPCPFTISDANVLNCQLSVCLLLYLFVLIPTVYLSHQPSLTSFFSYCLNYPFIP